MENGCKPPTRRRRWTRSKRPACGQTRSSLNPGSLLSYFVRPAPPRRGVGGPLRERRPSGKLHRVLNAVLLGGSRRVPRYGAVCSSLKRPHSFRSGIFSLQVVLVRGHIFELFSTAHAARTHFLVRTAVDRLAGQGGTTVAKVMKRQPIRGLHEVAVRDDHGHVSTATVQVRFCRVAIHPTPAKRKQYGPLLRTVIHAYERGGPRAGSRSGGNCSLICRWKTWSVRSRNWTGMRCVGKSRCFTRC